MAGFFGLFDYNKPGKGVDPDAPKKRPFFLFWELIWRKLSRLVLLNVMYFVCLLPIISLIYTRFYAYFLQLLPSNLPAEEMVLGPLPSVLTAFATGIPYPLFVVLLALSVILYGPATCGFTYVLRNFAREEHAWISDFFVQLKRNFKQGLIIGVLEVLLYAILFMNLTLTAPADASSAVRFFFTASKYLSVFFAVVFTYMRHYTYMMIVTFRLSVGQILKNALIFAVLGIGRNLLVSVLIVASAVLFLLLSELLGGWVEFIILPLFLLSFWGFLSTFTCYPVIKKYMLDTQPEAPGDPDGEAGES